MLPLYEADNAYETEFFIEYGDMEGTVQRKLKSARNFSKQSYTIFN